MGKRKKWSENSYTNKHFSNFWRSLEMPLINCKVKLSLKWFENCVLTTAVIGANANATGADSATFKITDAKLYVPIVALSTEDSTKLVKQLSEGFKRSVYWNQYKIIVNKVVQITRANNEKQQNCLIQVMKELKDCLFLPIIMLIMMQIVLMMILSKNTFFRK